MSMALFSKNKNEEKEAATEKSTAASAKKTTQIATKDANDVTHVLISPRVSEKAMLLTEQNVYVFNVSPRANKRQIIRAIEEQYNVTPIKVAVTSIKRKRVRNMRTGIPGVTKGGKKAYVYLKKGDSISLV